MSRRWVKRRALMLHKIKGRQSNNKSTRTTGRNPSGFLMRKSEVIEVADYVYFTEEQKEEARNKDIVSFLQSQGEKVKRSGSEYVWMDGNAKVTIRGNLWYHQYEEYGNDVVAFVQRYCNMTYPEAVEYLLGGCGSSIQTSEPIEQEKKAFELPQRNPYMRRVYGYLLSERKLDKSVIDIFVKQQMIYEDAKYHNVVFVGFDKERVPRHAHKRGSTTGSTYRGNVEGCMPQHSFHWHGTSEELFVFEAPIDMLSYISLHQEKWWEHSYASCCGVAGYVMWQMMEDNPAIKKVWLCLDNDEQGEKAAIRLLKELEECGIEYGRKLSVLKDWNCDLMYPEEVEEVLCNQLAIQLS